MFRQGYGVVVCEGKDQVGKADVILNLSRKLLSQGIPVTYSSFPIYATPWGSMIRHSLVHGLTKFFPITSVEELKVRYSFYAINRLEFMEVLLSKPEYKDTIVLLDRSPFSNAVTTVYGLANINNPVQTEEVKELVHYFMDLEQFMIKKMNLKNCVIQLSSEDREWENLREEEGDIFERKNVQDATDQVYQICQDIVGDGWKKFITKTKEGWRSREDIEKEVYEFLFSRIPDIQKKQIASMYDIRYEIGIEEILEKVYKGSELPSGILSKYLKALRENEKDLMYKYAYEIGQKVGKSCQIVRFKNRGVRNAIKGIIKKDSKIMEIVSELMSDSFADKFYWALDE